MRRAVRLIVKFVRALAAEDQVVTRIALVLALVQSFACLWDLPGHSWENDGIAPGGVFDGLIDNLVPGSASRYPLLHFVISLVASLPALLLIPVLSPSLSGEHLVATATSVGVMTGVAVCVKLVTIAMSSLTLLLIARYARNTFDVRAGRWTALFFMVNLSLSYYGRVSNLDAPYLMWVALGLDRWISLDSQPARAAVRDYRILGVFCALAIATKDQAYATVLPLLLVPALRKPSRGHTGGLVQMVIGFVGAYVVASGAVFNPTGFVARIRLLTGPNSQDWRWYDDTVLGLRQNIHDLVLQLPAWWWPLPVLMVCAIGLVAAGVRALRSRSLAPLMPFFMALSTVVLFTLVVKRAEHRFLLPAAFLATYYAGVGAAVLLRIARGALRERAIEAGLAACVVAAALHCAALIATQWSDGRRAVSAWLARQPRGTLVETYGWSVYQPHFDTSPGAPYRVMRLEPPGHRPWDALPGVPSVHGLYHDVKARGPDVLVVAESFAQPYLSRALPPGFRFVQEAKAQQDVDAVTFFSAALRDQLPGYHLCWTAAPALPRVLRAMGLEPVRIHGSTGTFTWVLTRNGFHAAD
ncbi:MAG TPA: hypothetical protein VFB50_07660 [Chloroflexota bacterium]|nr:hypothetical protein [Chloroflexota bacterium]